MTKVASPISTGGAGSDYEKRVGAYYLAALLLQAVPRGQEAGVTREVRFQRLYEGEPLDDLIIVSELPVGEAKLALQIKRDLSFGENETFGEVIQACWETFKSTNFHIGIDRFGIGIGLYSKNIDEYYQSVLTWARTSTDADDFLKRINQPRLANQTQRSFVQLIRGKLDSYSGSSVTDDEIWNFLRSMVILYFDFQRDGSRDYSYSVEIVSHLLNADKKAEAPQLFTELVDLAAEANRTAGRFNADILTQRLQAKFSLLSPVDCRSELEKLRQESGCALNDIRVDIGGLSLSRTELIVNALEKLSEASLIEIVASSGVGKSALLKTLVEHQRGEGPVLVISGDRITGAGWSSYASTLQLRQPLNKLLVALSGSSRPTIFIDGIDRIVEIGKRAVVNDLLRTLAGVPLSEDGSRHWTVVFSTREENLQDVYLWLDWQALGKPTRLQVPELTEEELQSIVENSLRLKPLLSLSQLSPILKNPLMLRLLEDPRMLPNPEDLPPVATEIEISKVWWDRLVGNEGSVSGRGRKNSLLRLGKLVIKSPGKHFPVEETVPPESIVSLTADRIIVQDPDREVYRFSHDLLEDWVMYRLLDQRREDLSAYLQELDEPFGLYRAVQLLGLALLENSKTADSWIQLIEQVEQASELSSRWRQALLTAPLVSPRSSELLDKAEPLLIADNARRLIELLVAVRTLEVMPNFSLMFLFTEAAIAAAKELQTSENFAETDKEDIRGVTRLQAIAGVAAAILIADFEWARTQNHLEWSRAILLAAARMAEASMYAMSPSSVKVYVGGLQNAWNVDPVLCWNALNLCLSLSVIPGKLYYGTPVGEFGTSFEELETWEDNVIQNHFDYLAKDEIPELPRIPTARNIVFVHEQAKYGLYALPLTELCRDSDTKDKLLQLSDDLVARTIADNLPVESKAYLQPDRPYTWNPFIFNWVARLAKSLSVEETCHHILTPLRDNWSQVPQLMAELLDGYISHQIAYVEGPTAQALEIWKEICNWVLDSPEIARKASYDYLDRDTGEVLQLIVFTQHGSSRIKDNWQHAHLFIDIFDKWVRLAGHHPYAYSHLLTMLNGIGWQFAPEPTLEWLNRCASNAVHNLWNEERGNGRRTAELLNRIWNGFERQIRGNRVILQRYSNLVYRLVEAGIPLASVLRQKLEGRG